MKRFVLQQLIEWKNREDRKPLILNGARQVGKTWLLHEFAKLEYKKEAYVVCRKNNPGNMSFHAMFVIFCFICTHLLMLTISCCE